MAWNEPGGGGQDPWKTPHRSGDNAPKVDQWLKDLQRKMGAAGGDS